MTTDIPNSPNSPNTLHSLGSHDATLPEKQARNPLHGLTLESILTELVTAYSWEGLGQQINIRCFTSDPSIASSLKFLRKTPWAREKVEGLFLFMQREQRRGRLAPSPSPAPTQSQSQSHSAKTLTLGDASGPVKPAPRQP